MVPHEVYRHYERTFPTVRLHDGMPFIPWSDLQSKIPKTETRKLADAVEEHFNAERLIVSGHTSELSTDPVQNNGAAYLSLERALHDSEMKKCVKKGYSAWDSDTPVEVQPVEYEHNPDLLYSPDATPGLYALHCGTTQSYTDGQMVVVKESFAHDIFCKLRCVVSPPLTPPLPPLSHFLTLDPGRALPLAQNFRSPATDHHV